MTSRKVTRLRKIYKSMLETILNPSSFVYLFLNEELKSSLLFVELTKFDKDFFLFESLPTI